MQGYKTDANLSTAYDINNAFIDMSTAGVFLGHPMIHLNFALGQCGSEETET